jgi:hypothetical protein
MLSGKLGKERAGMSDDRFSRRVSQYSKRVEKESQEKGSGGCLKFFLVSVTLLIVASMGGAVIGTGLNLLGLGGHEGGGHGHPHGTEREEPYHPKIAPKPH